MRVLKFIFEVIKPFKLHVIGLMLVVIVNAIDNNARPYLIKLLIDKIAFSNLNNLLPIVIVYTACHILMMLSWTFSDWCITKFYTKFRIHISFTLMSKISSYSYSFFQNNLAGSLTAKISDNFNNIPSIIFITNYQFLSFILTSIVTLVLLAKIHIIFPIGLIIWIAFFLSVLFVGMKKVIPLTKDYAEARSVIWGNISDCLSNMLGVRLFAASKFELDRLNHISEDFVKKNEKHGFFLMYFYTIQGIIYIFYSFIFIIFLIHLKDKELITAGDFALVFMLNFKIADKLFELSHQLRDFINYWGTVDQALGILDVVPEVIDAVDAKILQVDQGEITFKNVQFCYKGVTPLFQNKSVTILSGQKVGLVGYSGSGKTTFVNLVLRLYDIDSGQILIDKQDIKDVTQNSLHKNIGMIPQDPALFHRSIMENIRYGRLDATDEEVVEAAKRAHAHEFIEKLPDKYNALVGERGVKLSGGQRQRIAIARAILKNAPILILDEATSQLDSLTENYIQEAMWKLMQGKTTIIIAHRLSTLLHMDRILVFDKGKVVEEGNHDELLALDGLYKILWMTQVEGFLPEKR